MCIDLACTGLRAGMIVCNRFRRVEAWGPCAPRSAARGARCGISPSGSRANAGRRPSRIWAEQCWPSRACLLFPWAEPCPPHFCASVCCGPNSLGPYPHPDYLGRAPLAQCIRTRISLGRARSAQPVGPPVQWDRPALPRLATLPVGPAH